MLKLIKSKPVNITYGNRKVYVRKGFKLVKVIKVGNRDMLKLFNEVRLLLNDR